ncbi:MAG: hypothetical protein HYV28_13525 [Ignavibacteriales bacterium]|nr:hypothetical protein [Ignavibacteriales bacterium]
MIQKNFLLLVLFVVVISIPGCYTVLWSPGEEISDKEYVNYTDEPVIYEPGCWGCYYNPSPWWYIIVTTEEKDNPRRLPNKIRETGERPSGGINPHPGSNPPIITVSPPGRPYTPPSNPRPITQSGGSAGGGVTQPITPTKAPEKKDVDGSNQPAPRVTTEKRRDAGTTEQTQSNDRDRSKSNTNNDNNSSTRNNGGGRR